MRPDPKPEKPYRSKKYLAFIRKTPCPYCGMKAEPHHVRRSYWGAGLAIKPHDFVAVPRCRDHHGPKFEDSSHVEIIELLIHYLKPHDKDREIIQALMEVCDTV